MQSSQRDQSQQFLGLGWERTRLIRLVVQREEPLDAQVATPQDLFVQRSAEFLKLFQIRRHVSLKKEIVTLGFERSMTRDFGRNALSAG